MYFIKTIFLKLFIDVREFTWYSSNLNFFDADNLFKCPNGSGNIKTF